MRELMHEVAKLIEDLKSLKLLKESDYYTTLIKDEQQKYSFRISLHPQGGFSTTMLSLCLEQFRKLEEERKEKFAMEVIEHSKSNSFDILAVEYTEL